MNSVLSFVTLQYDIDVVKGGVIKSEAFKLQRCLIQQPNTVFLFYKNNFVRTCGSILHKIEEQIKNNASFSNKKKIKNKQNRIT